MSKAFRIATLGGVSAVTAITVLPHTLFPSKFRYHNEMPGKKPDERFESLLKDVCLQMNIDSNKIDLFINQEFNAVSSGCLHFPRKSVIGLPRNCVFSSVEDLKRMPILYQEKSIRWDSKIGKALEDTMLISDEHVKFLLARELNQIKKMDFSYSTLHALGICTYFISLLSFGFFQLSIYTRAVQFVLLALGFAACELTSRELSLWREYKRDTDAARLGLEYCIGGIDCMRNRLKLNRIIRKLNDPVGGDIFSEKGDNFVDNHYPLRSERLNKLKQIKLSSSEEIIA